MTASAKGCTEASRVKILPGCIGLHAYKIEPLQKQKRAGCHWLQHTDVTHVHMNSLPDVFNTSRFPDGAVSCMYLSSIGSRTGAMSIYQATADGLPLPSFRTRVPPTFRCQRLPLYDMLVPDKLRSRATPSVAFVDHEVGKTGYAGCIGRLVH